MLTSALLDFLEMLTLTGVCTALRCAGSGLDFLEKLPATSVQVVYVLAGGSFDFLEMLSLTWHLAGHADRHGTLTGTAR